MPTVEPVKIDGLRQFQAALRSMEDGLQKELRVVLNAAADLVIADARPKIPRRTGAAAASLKARSGQREAKIQAGGSKAPYFGWLDYGGRVGPAKSVSRPFIRGGRYIYPAFSRNRAKVTDVMVDGLADLARRSGLAVTEER
jgi:hypothetical protein